MHRMAIDLLSSDVNLGLPYKWFDSSAYFLRFLHWKFTKELNHTTLQNLARHFVYVAYY
jgi:hypothetical protein